MLPPPFLSQMRDQLGAELPAFLEAMAAPPPVSIRWNSYKKINWEENLEGVKWYNNGVYLPERPSFTLDPRFHGGAYYVQEASSMLIAAAVGQLIDSAAGPLRALDLCAAPGGKSTLLADVLPEGSFLLCNEVIRQRYQVLQYNLAKWGSAHTHLSQHDSADFGGLEGFFDLVLLDAPCSGEGMFRKDPGAIGEWSPEQVAHNAARQRRIIAAAAPLLRPGGILLYSTCTYNDAENSDNVAWMCKELDMEFVPLDFPADWQIAARPMGYQCYPHRVRGEGLFLAGLRRSGGQPHQGKARGYKKLTPLPKAQQAILNAWLANPDQYAYWTTPDGTVRAVLAAQLTDSQLVDNALKNWATGFEVGEIKGKDFIPSPALAFSRALSPQISQAPLDAAEAMRFLRKEDLRLSPIPQGIRLATYESLGLGWFKGLPNRINNYYPVNWRVMMGDV